MSAQDDVFPDKPTIPRRPRPAAPPSDFDDPVVKAKARALHAASAGNLVGLARCTDPMLCQVGDHAHRLAIAEYWPMPGERRTSHLRTWEWDEAGFAWRCETVHSPGGSAA
jgi:hypothetical protein